MLLEQKTTDFLEQLSSSAPIPGGGGASAAVGAFASALGLMVTNLTVGKKKYADVEEEILEIREKLEQKKQDLVRMVDEDAEAFEPLAKAYRMPKETEEEQAEKEKVMEAALKNAAEAPLCIMKTIVDTMEMIRVLGEKGSRLAVSDAGVAILFAQAALEGASLNIFINTKMMKDQEEAERLNYLADQLIATGKELKDKGYSETLFHRKRYLPELASSNHMMRAFGERVARNMPIQGTAADIIKIAMVKVDDRLAKENMKSRLILQVHDELLIETCKEEIPQVSAILEEEMKGAAKLSVELEVDMHQGNNWYEAK